jgi:hypothetical protein
VPDLLINTTALTGFPSPDTFQRFLASVEWADEASGDVCLAMVARAEMIDPEKFGVTVAANRGLVSNFYHRARGSRLARRQVRPGTVRTAEPDAVADRPDTIDFGTS